MQLQPLQRRFLASLQLRLSTARHNTLRATHTEPHLGLESHFLSVGRKSNHFFIVAIFIAKCFSVGV